MRFVCDDCGFSAETPEKRNTCPMCQSENIRYPLQNIVYDNDIVLEENFENFDTSEYREKTATLINVVREKAAKIEKADRRKNILFFWIIFLSLIAIVTLLVKIFT
ncbi:hypothetical protein J6Z39_00225 [bacterium]|jgi:hypothetical protein|nr:hypothetical protein [bacterium]MBP5434224.1 hypothetical protein [bacterium]MBR6245585.1 hypothetical protein [bacterium]